MTWTHYGEVEGWWFLLRTLSMVGFWVLLAWAVAAFVTAAERSDGGGTHGHRR